MMRMTTKMAMIGIGLGSMVAMAAGKPEPLLPLNTTEGLRPTWGQTLESHAETVVSGATETTDGNGALRLRARTGVTREITMPA